MRPSAYRPGRNVIGVGLICAALVATAGTTMAQVVSCSKFLHNRDGSWSSFDTGDVLGSRGVVHIHTGERFSRRGTPAQADLAQILDGMCQSD